MFETVSGEGQGGDSVAGGPHDRQSSLVKSLRDSGALKSSYLIRCSEFRLPIVELSFSRLNVKSK